MSFIPKSTVTIASLVIVIVVLFRWLSGDCDFSYFIVAGSDFVDQSAQEHIQIQKGPGYDGQFFYRFALDPSGKEDLGITVDYPAYRHQRILYPLLSWLLAFGQGQLVPFTLILINALSLLFSCLIFEKIVLQLGLNRLWGLTPLLISGAWMGLGRDLAEPINLFFLIALLHEVHFRRYWSISLLSLLCLFTRESSAILILPMALSLAWIIFKEEKLSARALGRYLLLFLPYALAFIWKVFLFNYHQSEKLIEGSSHLSIIPFLGLLHGMFYVVKNTSGLMGVVELLVWFMHLAWNIWLVVLCIRLFRRKPTGIPEYLRWMWMTSFVLALFFTRSIYWDDWGFGRVLTGFNLISLLVLFYSRERPSKMFLLYTFALVSSTLGRLWIKV